ncbi:MAG: dihydroorotase [Cyanobacteriota bacterium]|nr:dihydroorotase [Cyanobacteriota bacterium]
MVGSPTLLLRGVQTLMGPGQPLQCSDVWIGAGEMLAVAPEDTDAAMVLDAQSLLLAPCLVDPHSLLEEHLQGRAETLDSLMAAAAAGGYGTVAVLPQAEPWRDRPELLLQPGEPQARVLSWGAFSNGGANRELAPHAELLAAGAIGLAGGAQLPPTALVEKALRLGEALAHPLLLAPRDASLTGGGFLRERVEALRLGWPTDPAVSETLPLQTLLALARLHPRQPLRLMNLSTDEGVALLRQAGAEAPQASVCWWHLVADSANLAPHDEGWRMEPSLGAPRDRQALIAALADGVITAVAVHHSAQDHEEQLLPLDQRRPGVAGHGLVLSLLWQELVVAGGWTPEQLWQALCWGPCAFLGLPPEQLGPGCRRWLLFDPQRPWQPASQPLPSQAANQPFRERQLTGQVVASGLSDPATWQV